MSIPTSLPHELIASLDAGRPGPHGAPGASACPDARARETEARMTDDERNAHTKLLEDAKKEYASIPKAMSVGEGSVGDLRSPIGRRDARCRGPTDHCTHGA